ncbi:MAG: hypothetical protein U1A72_08975 [Sulfuritalea sp.]|nr:hypothetical protein [Sulfuritalea sp.]
MNRAEAIASGAKQYNGKLCAEHPAINGQRRLSSATCVECDKHKVRQWAAQNQEYIKQYKRDYRAGHKAKLAASDKARANDPVKRPAYLERQRNYSKARPEKERERSALRRKDPEYKAKQLAAKRRWRTEHRDQHRATNRAYDAGQLRENLQRRISKNLRHRICKAMMGKTRGVSAVRDLGISISEFRDHIQRQFAPGMSWENYGQWHLDHKKPLKAFDLTDIEQARVACHFTNYQPLWAEDNIRKHCK